MFKNALISTSNKTGLVEFLKPLVEGGLRIVSTGGTSRHLRDHGLPVVEVSEQTGFPEVMDGRVRTLHPSIHMPLLARAGSDEDMRLLDLHGLQPFDLVIVNLYPFGDALNRGVEGAELIEYIDIGGPSLLRAAAKSYDRIAVVCDPQDYVWLGGAARAGQLSLEQRRGLAAKVFKHTSSYDTLVAHTLAPTELSLASLNGELVQELRYGENPQQKALWMKNPGAVQGLFAADILHGKALSYNNLLDLECAVRVVRDLSRPAAVAVKHGNPCGVGTSRDAATALARCLAADPVSVFGGIIAINRTLDAACAQSLAKIFIECVIAPGYEPDALATLTKKKDIRVLKWPEMLTSDSNIEFRNVSGGYILQTVDSASPPPGDESFPSDWTFVGEHPDATQMADLRLAWVVAAHLKSNAIALACDGMSIGLGMGQVNRVDAVEQALARARKHHPDVIARAVLASDAFFPFADSIELIASSGVRWVVQPGGSVRDGEVIAKAQELGVNLVLTGRRHFRH